MAEVMSEALLLMGWGPGLESRLSVSADIAVSPFGGVISVLTLFEVSHCWLGIRHLDLMQASRVSVGSGSHSIFRDGMDIGGRINSEGITGLGGLMTRSKTRKARETPDQMVALLCEPTSFTLENGVAYGLLSQASSISVASRLVAFVSVYFSRPTFSRPARCLRICHPARRSRICLPARRPHIFLSVDQPSVIRPSTIRSHMLPDN
ncbi:GGDEF domain-containing protein [Sesbania bispinosa]|nr:GGDEF domain-containing protein [Sesbania bispinosa]